MSRLLLLLDWDETITAQDTLSLIAPQPGQQSQGPDFSWYTAQYLGDMEKHSQAFGPRDSLEKLMLYLDSLDSVERASVARVEQGGLFKGVAYRDILSRASQVQFRPGWNDVASWLKSNDSQVDSHIISVGWSASLIRQALVNEGLPSHIPHTICANEIEMDKHGLGTGKMTKSKDVVDLATDYTSGIRTGMDKLHHFERLQREHQPTMTVYVGDSTTDLPCLLKADLGLVMGDNASLRTTCQQLGIDVYRGPVVDVGQLTKLVGVDDWTTGLPWLQSVLSQCDGVTAAQ